MPKQRGRRTEQDDPRRNEVGLDFAREWVEFVDPGRSRTRRTRRPHLAVLAVDLHLRCRLPRRGRDRGPGLLQPRRVLHRRRRREAGREGRRRTRREHLAARQIRRPQGFQRPRLDRLGQEPAAHPQGRRRLHLPQPARLRRRRGLRPARARAAHRPAPAGDQAGRLLAAADPARAGLGRAARRDQGAGRHRHRVRPARLGRRRARPALVVHLGARGARRRRAAVRVLRPRARSRCSAGRRTTSWPGSRRCRLETRRWSRPHPAGDPG